MKIKALLLIVCFYHSDLRSNTIAPQSLQDAEKYTPVELKSYHQTEYKLIDPAGDYALLKRAQLVPERILKKLAGQEIESTPSRSEYYENNGSSTEANYSLPVQNQNLDEKIEDYFLCHPNESSLFRQINSSKGADSLQDFLMLIENIQKPIQGRDNPLIRNGFSKMFTQIIAEERKTGIEPSYGIPHEWSKEFLDKYRHTSPMLASSKLLMALAVGETNRYMQTDKEGDLYRWMIAQNERSLEIPDVFRQSYRLNKGDIYKTLLTIENVLAHQWRNPKRENLPVTKRLKPITSGHQYDKDKFGTWYHLFGIMLYGYVEGGTKANLIGRVEALGSKMLSPATDKTQKAWMNREGGPIGSDLAEIVKSKSYLKHTPDESLLVQSNYLNTTEDFRDRITVPLDQSIKSSLETTEDRTYVHLKNTAPRELKKCEVEMIPDMGLGFDSRFKDSQKNVTIDSSSQPLTFFAPKIQRIRGFVKCEGREEVLVFESK